MAPEDGFTKNQWLSLAASVSGWALDAMDWMMLALLLPLIGAEFGLSLPQLGLLATLTLAGAAIGGIIVGVLADYYGRVRMLMLTMLWYSVFTGVCAFMQSYEQLCVARFFTGIGLGGEWAVGAALVSEYWPDRHRAKITSLVHSGWPVGYGLASLAFMLVGPTYGWRGMFLVGVLPALAAILIRLTVPEPEEWVKAKEARGRAKEATPFPLAALFSPGLLRNTLWCSIFTTGALMAYWGAGTWLPSYLASVRGLTIVKSGGFLLLLNVGGFLGYQFYGWLADRHGRRLALQVGFGAAIVSTLIYVMLPSEDMLFWFGPIFAFNTYGVFGPFGAYISELFPTEARAAGTAFCFNVGRAVSMSSPFIIGLLAQGYGLSFGLGATMVFNLIGIIALVFLPETVRAGKKVHFASTKAQAPAVS
ncbi:MAG: MFS transporter [Rhodoplanes sp.]|uniref:MFS transporter n=1 Tax=Rhodoplanes sp. TaxID=1968906 RepID=UPI00182BE40F|nr:MFS transporter [Rhodoplanes sp.]NVO15783.1 MFS transporter [Rhodoplanes sp.]